MFTFAEKEFPLITAGTEDRCNSMIGTVSGFGVLLKRPTTWGMMREDRYTLELLQKAQTYTLSYFTKEFRARAFCAAGKSGRDSNKMKELALTSIVTPSGNIAFTEAKLIMECKLTQITTVSHDDFCRQEDRESLFETFKKEQLYRKMVFGEITRVWVQN
ncbi:MAG: flavin reductase [Oscillospiraceae bacterium]|nr:flavin reductase [Oscillospiraceae bacterium]